MRNPSLELFFIFGLWMLVLVAIYFLVFDPTKIIGG